MTDFHKLDIDSLHAGLCGKKFSSIELTKHVLARIKKFDPKLRSYVTVTEDIALNSAKKVDDKIAAGKKISPLAGIPASIKDILNTEGVRSTSCSKILFDFIPPYDATCITKLKENDYVLTGKVNADEFACGVSTEHSCHGPTKNPWDPKRIPGGSSGGSAVSVASGFSFYSIGTDTGGSVRCPAALCGVTGLKVTYGRVSRSGITSMASSWDTIGPIAKSSLDCAHILNAIAGHDDKDSTTPNVPVPDYTKDINHDIKGLKVGVPKEYFGEGVDPEISDIVYKGVKDLEKLGVKVKEVSLPMTKYAVSVYYIYMPAELSANLARYDGIRYGSRTKGSPKDLSDHYFMTRSEGFGDEIKRRIMIGTYVLSAGYYDAYYKKAQKVRTLIIRDFDEVLKDVSVLLAPVFPMEPFKLGEKLHDPLQMYMADVLTIPPSAAGIPALSVPCGFTKRGLPTGMQIIGPQFSEDLILRVGHNYQKATDWHKMMPTPMPS